MINTIISRLKTIAWLFLALFFCNMVNPALAETVSKPDEPQWTFLGLTFNKPLPENYKACTISPFEEGYTDERCITVFEKGYFVRYIWDELDTKDRYVELPKQEIPYFSAQRNIAVIVDKHDKLVYLSLVTKGVRVQDQLLAEIKEQFGEPTTFIVVDNNTPRKIPGLIGSYYAVWDKEDFWIRFVGQLGYSEGILEIGLQRLFNKGIPKHFY